MRCIIHLRFAFIFFVCFTLTGALWANAAVVEYDLVIEERPVTVEGITTVGMTINGTIPGPVLRFKEGDIARIRVHNRMDVETSIHWHGVLVPPDMDGVPYVSFPPIKPHSTFVYEFPIRQSGTYWYHSHTSLQEQSGVYGAIVIEPREKTVHYDREYVVLLSDWTSEDPHEVLRTLRRGSEWYSIQKGSAQSLVGAVKAGRLGDYVKRELLRMPPMDISDVAYDYFLANGRPEINLIASPGETVLIRLIDGSSMTYFHVEFAGGPISIVSADGLDVVPFEVKRFLISVAETYDIVVRVPAEGAYELRATAHDGSGFASIWIGQGKPVYAPDLPKPDIYSMMGKVTFEKVFALTPSASIGMPDSKVKSGAFDAPGMAGMKMQMNEMSMGMPMQEKTASANNNKKILERDIKWQRYGKKYSNYFRPLASDVASADSIAVDDIDPQRPGTPYSKLRSLKPTSYPSDKPVQEIRLTLDGDMERYVWFLNNKPLSESDLIRIKGGHIVRFIMINRTMMHHPMHLHGHFFRVINGQGEYSPLKHTVDVAPMSTTVIEFYTDEPGDWFFHCHLLYHLKVGMARVIHYDGFSIPPHLDKIRPNLFRDVYYSWGSTTVLSNMTYLNLTTSNTRNIITLDWEAGWRRVSSLDWELLITWDRYFNRFFKAFGGVDVLGYGPDVEDARLIAGIRYLLPFNVETRMWIDSDDGARVALGKSIDITPRMAVFGEWQYDTHTFHEGRAGISYLFSKSISIIGQWHSEYGIGAGIQVRF